MQDLWSEPEQHVSSCIIEQIFNVEFRETTHTLVNADLTPSKDSTSHLITNDKSSETILHGVLHNSLNYFMPTNVTIDHATKIDWDFILGEAGTFFHIDFFQVFVYRRNIITLLGSSWNSW